MAQTLDQARKLARTSIHGRRLGLDHDEFLVGVKDVRHVVTYATSSTTGTAIPNHGFVSVATTTNDTWTLTDPEAGVSVQLAASSSSTGIATVSCAAARIYSTAGETGTKVLLTSRGGFIGLMGLTTAIWAVTGRGSSASAVVSS